MIEASQSFSSRNRRDEREAEERRIREKHENDVFISAIGLGAIFAILSLTGMYVASETLEVPIPSDFWIMVPTIAFFSSAGLVFLTATGFPNSRRS